MKILTLDFYIGNSILLFYVKYFSNLYHYSKVWYRILYVEINLISLKITFFSFYFPNIPSNVYSYEFALIQVSIFSNVDSDF
jgi:hypothetical protein